MQLSREDSRAVDRFAIDKLGFHPLVLMENAGRGAAKLMAKLGIAGPIAVVCGKGNNGGDGFVVARHMLLVGQPCQVLATSPANELSPDARANYDLLVAAGYKPTEWSGDAAEFARLTEGCQAIVDALLGTGAQGDPRAPYAELIELINSAGKKVVALDVPSGLDCDTGQPGTPTIRAAATITFVASKRGFDCEGAKQFTGQVLVTDIGVPLNWLPPNDESQRNT